MFSIFLKTPNFSFCLIVTLKFLRLLRLTSIRNTEAWLIVKERPKVNLQLSRETTLVIARLLLLFRSRES